MRSRKGGRAGALNREVAAMREMSVEIPIADIGVDAFSTRTSIPAKRVDIDLSLVARVKVQVGIAPGICRHAIKVATCLPVSDTRIGGLRDQCFNALFRGRVGEIIEAIELHGIFDIRDFCFGLDDLGIVHATDYIRGDDGGKNANDDDHNHDLDQRKAALARR